MKKIYDTKDLQIISCLRNNARQSLKKISSKVGLPISTIFDRIRKLEKQSLIQGYTINIDFKLLSYPIRANIFLRANGNKDKFEAVAMSHFYVNNLIKLAGDEYNYLLEAAFPNMDEMSKFVERLADECKVESHKTYYVVNEIKKNAFLKNRDDVKVIMKNAG